MEHVFLNKKEETVSPAKQKIEQKPVASEVVKETVSLPEKPKNLQEKHPVVAETKSLKEPECVLMRNCVMRKINSSYMNFCCPAGA